MFDDSTQPAQEGAPSGSGRILDDPGSQEAEPVSPILDVASHFDDQYNETCDEVEEKPKRKRKSPASTARKTWTEEEETEIKTIFKTYFEEKRRPSPSACEKAIRKSKANKGVIQHRSKDTLKKKVFRMIDSLNTWTAW